MLTLDNAVVDSSTEEASPPLTSPIFPFSFWERSEAEDAAPPAVASSIAGPVDLCSLKADGWEIAEGTGGTMDKTAIDNGATEANQTVELSPWPTQPSYHVKMDLPVNLMTGAPCNVCTSAPMSKNDFGWYSNVPLSPNSVPLPEGTLWIQLYFPNPILITRIVLNLTNATITNYDVQIHECGRWKNLPTGDELYAKFGITVERDFAVALTTPTHLLRIVLYDVTVAGRGFASICANGFKSNVEGMPVVLDTPKLLPLQSRRFDSRLATADLRTMELTTF